MKPILIANGLLFAAVVSGTAQQTGWLEAFFMWSILCAAAFFVTYRIARI